MPLPTINNFVTTLNPGLAAAHLNHPPVTGGNEIHGAREGNLAWVGNTMQISAIGPINYCYIPAYPQQVSFGVVDCGAGGDFYVISDQYGGCEYHELYNAQYNMLAFLHVYRGGGITTTYTPAAGWELRSEKRSAYIAESGGMTGSNWSVSLVDRGTNPPTVTSKFVHVANPPFTSGQGYVGNFTVTQEDAGDTWYATQTAWRMINMINPFG